MPGGTHCLRANRPPETAYTTTGVVLCFAGFQSHRKQSRILKSPAGIVKDRNHILTDQWKKGICIIRHSGKGRFPDRNDANAKAKAITQKPLCGRARAER